MEDIIAIARILVALGFYITAYILPLVLILGALIRMALRWHASWRFIIATLLTALLQIFAIGAATPQIAAYFLGTALAIMATILYVIATRGHRGGIKLLLDAALFALVLVYIVATIDWVVG